MNYYRAVLKNFRRIKKRAQSGQKELWKKAVTSHNCYEGSVDVCTLQQVEELQRSRELNGLFVDLYTASRDILQRSEKQSLLLLLWYSGECDKNKLAKQFGCSRRTLYRRVSDALDSFSRKMRALGFDEEWFASCRRRFGGENAREKDCFASFR